MDVEVQTKYGAVRGYTTATHNIWKAIPYGAAPTEDLRWELPQAPKPWEGVKSAVAKGPGCPQPGYKPISEDCLLLNVFTPINASASSNLPVYIFIHGGSFWGGNGGDVDGELLSAKDLVVVAISYRLGAFGYLALPELLNTTSEHTYGFFGIQDQRFAFQWVKENIHNFGGNPNKITIGGQSAGAISVCIHVAAHRSANLFQHAIMESGSCVINTPLQSQISSEIVAQKLNCSDSPDVVECMKAKTMDEIVAATSGPIWPCPNDYEMAKQPIDTIREGQFNRVNLLVGTCHDEQSFEACPWFGSINATEYPATLNKLYGGHTGPLALKVYPVGDYVPPVAGIVAAWSDSRFKCPTLDMLNAIAPAQLLPTYMYSFERVPTWQKNKCLNVTHSTELPFLYPGGGVFPRSGNAEEKQLSDDMVEYWTSFITNGKPVSPSSGVVWEPFRNTTQEYLVLNTPKPHMEPHFREPYCKFWDNYIP